jgi:aminobenzoyl-glutamate utilization protein B
MAHKGMLMAARTLVSTAVVLLTDPQLRAEIDVEFLEATRGEPYESPLPEGLRPFDVLPRPVR